VWATFCGLVIIKLEGALSEIYDFLDVGLNLSVRKLQTSTVVFQVTHLIVLLSVLPKSNVYSAKLRPNDLAGWPSYLQQNCSHRPGVANTSIAIDQSIAETQLIDHA